MLSIYLNGSEMKKHHRLPSRKLGGRIILNLLLMGIFPRKNSGRVWTSLSINTSVVPSVNCLRCTCRLPGTGLLGNVTLVLLLGILTTNIVWLPLSSRNLHWLRVWPLGRLLRFRAKSLPISLKER